MSEKCNSVILSCNLGSFVGIGNTVLPFVNVSVDIIILLVMSTRTLRQKNGFEKILHRLSSGRWVFIVDIEYHVFCAYALTRISNGCGQ